MTYTISDYGFDFPIRHDPVSRPEHYSKGNSIECIDAMTSAFGKEVVEDYARVNAFKYIWRAHNKGKEKEDIQKAIWYLRFSIGEDPRAG
tara:strand:+ start:299 stop:568 length:270 start_codon:yes stop_codon:yes gene_type:complete